MLGDFGISKVCGANMAGGGGLGMHVWSHRHGKSRLIRWTLYA
jgi:hypothetical protein